MFVCARYDYHIFHKLTDNKTRTERMARTIGQLGSVTMGLLLLPVARNGIWEAIFGVSWEAALRFHRWMGISFLVLGLLHLCLWVTEYSDDPKHLHHMLGTSAGADYDDFTVP